MILKKYLITLNNILTKDNLEKFSKVVSSNYVSMNGGENVFIVLSSEGNALDIYKKLDSKTDFIVNFIVAELPNNWYGNLPEEVFEWLDENFPNRKTIKEV